MPLLNSSNRPSYLLQGFAHAEAPEEAAGLLQAASERLNPVETMIAELSPVIDTHAGPGTLPLTYHY